ncbi:ShlB/FhaC/HecB family hemolysin secretion/activation protein [Oceanimonas smirnovii]|uniref:ShlB/FhaC/HecB family hemolysin secretion/activation protein n=1 Tax=Oceanimonas smirnovii TaxID=264574 RepID=UPI00035C6BFC|nr:ShlB/FhaC/HecB family hemolysin secretion/activation protein [Oceanimonas smirnovii]
MLSLSTSSPVLAQVSEAEQAVVEQTIILQRLTPPQKRGMIDIDIMDQQDELSEQEAEKVTLVLNSVTVDGAFTLEPEQLRASWQSLLGKEITLADLYQVARDIDAAYLAAGYFSMTVVPVQDLESGHVHFQVYEGYVERVEITSDIPGMERRLAPYIDRLMAMQPIRVKEAERVLLLMSDLAGVNIEGTFIKPDTPRAGGLLKLNIGFNPRSVMVALDNFGSDEVGPYELAASAGFNDVFGYFESSNLLALTIPDAPEQMSIFQLSQNMPLGYNGLFTGYNLSYIEQQPGGSLALQHIEVESVVVSAELSYPFVRTLQQSLFGRAEVTFQHDDVDIMSTAVARTRIRRAELMLDYDSALSSGDLSAMAGVGAGHISDMDLGEQPGNYHYWRAALNYLYPVNNNINMQLRTVGQHSPMMLPASSQFSVGGFSFGRAFESGAISGDSGMAAAAELMYEVTTDLSLLPSVVVTPFIDYGVTREHQPGARAEYQELGSYGISLGGTLADRVLFEVSAGLPWHKPADTDESGGQLLFRLSSVF